MKILIATGLYAPEIGGPATHTDILEREMPAFGIDVVVVPFSRVRAYPKVIRHLRYCLSLLFHARGAALIYALDPVSVGLPALLASKFTGKPFVLRVAGDYAWEQAVGRYGTALFLDQFVTKVRTQPLAVRTLAAVERFVARGAVRIVVPSQYLKRIVMSWGIPETKIQVVYNAFIAPQRSATREQARAQFGLSGTVVASAGRFVSWKGFRALIEAFAEVRKDRPDALCVIVGDGPDHAALVAHAKELKVAEYVRFLGVLPHADLVTLLAGVDVFVLNTAYEGFSHQLLEVMSLGVPVITTNVGGNSELIDHEKTGLFVPFNDTDALAAAMLHVLSNSSVAETLRTSARERATSFTVPNMLLGIKRVFDTVSK